MTNVKFFFKRDSDYKVISPTDVWGQVSAKGGITMDFITDVPRIPEIVAHELNKEGAIDQAAKPMEVYDCEIKKDSDLYIDRLLHNKVILSPEIALNIAVWMIKSIVQSSATEIDRAKLKIQIDELFKKGKE